MWASLEKLDFDNFTFGWSADSLFVCNIQLNCSKITLDWVFELSWRLPGTGADGAIGRQAPGLNFAQPDSYEHAEIHTT